MSEFPRASAYGPVLIDSKPLRLLTLFVFYLNQGIAPGFFVFALPAWLAVNDVSTGSIATIVSASALPWSIKFLFGSLIDRYAFLPMGRRRAWIVGAQIALLIVMLLAAALSPAPGDVILMAALGFAANLAVNFQDVSIDALAIDIMAEDERARASGVMFGAQVFGISLTTALAGWMLDTYGFAAAICATAVIPALTIVFGLTIIERRGERHVPWGRGEAHPNNRAVQPEKWWSLIVAALRGLSLPISLTFIPLLILRALPSGAFETFHPQLFTGIAGWGMTSYTSLVAATSLITGTYAIVIGGWVVEKIGERRTLALCAGGIAALAVLFGSLPEMWTNILFLLSFVVAVELLIMTYAIALIPIAMRLCVPAVAATQFVIYMGLGGMGRPLGALVAGVTAGEGSAQALYWTIGAAMAVTSVWALYARVLDDGRTDHRSVDTVLRQGNGLAPKFD